MIPKRQRCSSFTDTTRISFPVAFVNWLVHKSVKLQNCKSFKGLRTEKEKKNREDRDCRSRKLLVWCSQDCLRRSARVIRAAKASVCRSTKEPRVLQNERTKNEHPRGSIYYPIFLANVHWTELYINQSPLSTLFI